MQPYEADQVIVRLSELWPDWQPLEAEINEWKSGMENWSLRSALDAVSAHWRSCRFKTPRFNGVADERAKALTVDRDSSFENQGGTHTGYYVMCVEAPADRPRMLGFFEGVYVAGRPPEHIYHEFARRSMDRCANVYGGRWMMMTQTNQFAMMSESRRLRNEAGL